jgi:hypothetical protein
MARRRSSTRDALPLIKINASCLPLVIWCR